MRLQHALSYGWLDLTESAARVQCLEDIRKRDREGLLMHERDISGDRNRARTSRTKNLEEKEGTL